MSDLDFIQFPKIPRFNSPVMITEKIDGTNGVVHVSEDGTVRAGSRNRWITPNNDNYGFALWVSKHENELRNLGPGYHYGEWIGLGINRGYDLFERRFYLFNVTRWSNQDVRPACCHVVPVIETGLMKDINSLVDRALNRLLVEGSVAFPGYSDPEGIVVYHEKGRVLFKITLQNDEGKS